MTMAHTHMALTIPTAHRGTSIVAVVVACALDRACGEQLNEHGDHLVEEPRGIDGTEHVHEALCELRVASCKL